MKKIIAITLLLLVASVGVNAKVKFGLRGGLNIASMSISSDVLSASNRAGFYVGPTVKIGLPLGFDIDASALYDQRESEIAGETFKKKTADIQLNIRKGFGLGDKASVFIFGGPQYGFNIGDKNLLKTSSYDWTWKSSDFSVNVGLGVVVMNHVEVRANYNIACGKTADAHFGDAVNNTISPKTNAWQIGLAYYF